MGTLRLLCCRLTSLGTVSEYGQIIESSHKRGNQMNQIIKLITTFAFSAGLLACVGWGATYAQDAETGESLQPAAIAQNATQIVSGEAHSCAITEGGAVQCWGSNAHGQLGDGGGGVECGYDNDEECRAEPVQVVGVTQGVMSIAAGRAHTCAVLTNGDVKCWGANWAGQLGDGTIEDRNVPVTVQNLDGSAQTVTAGNAHTCALTNDGAAKCWGANWAGQLGDGTAESRNFPVSVVGLSSGVTMVSAGEEHTCALTAGGGAKCWGSTWWGQLGDGSDGYDEDRLQPVDVTGLESGVRQIIAAERHTCAVLNDGSVKCWGNGDYGQLGIGDTSSVGDCRDDGEVCQLTPIDVIGLDENVHSVDAQGSHTCAVLESGKIKCWGLNRFAQLGSDGNDSLCNGGLGTNLCSLAPAEVGGLGAQAQTVAAGGEYTCALLQDGSIQCWGFNEHGQLGFGAVGRRDVKTPVDVVGLNGAIQHPAAGGSHNCLLFDDDSVWCWGGNQHGQLGDGTLMPRNTPVPVSGLGDAAISIEGGNQNTCAVTSAGSVKCWGNVPGLDYPNGPEDGTVPRVIPGLESGALSVSLTGDAGGGTACAVMADGGVKCWGNNLYGQLGDGTRTYSHTPVDVVGLDGRALWAVARWGHTCALLESGEVQCWGSNQWGQMGIGQDAGCDPQNGGSLDCHHTAPVTVDALGSNVTAITGGWAHMCALVGSGGVKCWGLNNTAQIGDGTVEPPDGMLDVSDIRYTPTDVVGLDSGVEQVDAFSEHTCAVLDNGNVMCWGYNEHAQLGDGGGVPCGNGRTEDLCQPTPVGVAGLGGSAAHVAAGVNHSCALLENGGMQCWGGNYYGTSGDGNRWRPEPIYVSAFEALASLTISKTVVGGSPVSDWQFEGSGSIGDFTLLAAGGSDSFALDFGTYTITETMTAGYATQVGCTDGTSASGNAVTVTLAPGVSVGCTFTNTQLTTSVEGIVHDEQGAGIEGATVFLTDTLPADLIGALGDNLSDVTDADGNFRIEGVPLGDYSLMVSLPGESAPSYTQPLTVSSDPVTITEPIVVSTREAVFLPSMQKP